MSADQQFHCLGHKWYCDEEDCDRVVFTCCDAVFRVTTVRDKLGYTVCDDCSRKYEVSELTRISMVRVS